MRQVLVITDKARTIYAAPCDCARGRAMSHPPNLDIKDIAPPSFDVFADQQRRKGHEVIVTNRHEARIALKDSNPAAWARALAHIDQQPENPYRKLVEGFKYRDVADLDEEDTVVEGQ